MSLSSDAVREPVPTTDMGIMDSAAHVSTVAESFAQISHVDENDTLFKTKYDKHGHLRASYEIGKSNDEFLFGEKDENLMICTILRHLDNLDWVGDSVEIGKLIFQATDHSLKYFNKYRSKETLDMMVQWTNAFNVCMSRKIRHGYYGYEYETMYDEPNANNYNNIHSSMFLFTSVCRDYMCNGDLTFIREGITPFGYILEIIMLEIRKLRKKHEEMVAILDECRVSYTLESGEEITLTPELCRQMIKWTRRIYPHTDNEIKELVRDIEQFDQTVDEQEKCRRDHMCHEADILECKYKEIMTNAVNDPRCCNTLVKENVFNIMFEEKVIRNACDACDTRRSNVHTMYTKFEHHMESGQSEELRRIADEYSTFLERPKMVHQIETEALGKKIARLTRKMSEIKNIFEQFASKHHCRMAGYYAASDIKKCCDHGFMSDGDYHAIFEQYFNHLQHGIMQCNFLRQNVQTSSD